MEWTLIELNKSYQFIMFSRSLLQSQANDNLASFLNTIQGDFCVRLYSGALSVGSKCTTVA